MKSFPRILRIAHDSFSFRRDVLRFDASALFSSPNVLDVNDEISDRPRLRNTAGEKCSIRPTAKKTSRSDTYIFRSIRLIPIPLNFVVTGLQPEGAVPDDVVRIFIAPSTARVTKGGRAMPR